LSCSGFDDYMLSGRRKLNLENIWEYSSLILKNGKNLNEIPFCLRRICAKWFTLSI